MSKEKFTKVLVNFLWFIITVVALTYYATRNIARPQSIYILVEHKLFLPLVCGNSEQIVIGVQAEFPTSEFLATNVPKYYWIQTPIYWNLIEATRGTYNWNTTISWWNISPDSYLPDENHYIILGTRGTPTWARFGTLDCSGPKKEYWPEYVKYVSTAIDRYKPDAIAIYNEPEPDESMMPSMPVPFYGCWGSNKAEFYAEFTKYVYKALKARYPDLIIISGELMAIDLSWATRAINAGMVGDYFSYHYYPTYQNPASWDGWYRKYLELSALAPNARWIMSETALLDTTLDCDNSDFRDVQAQYAEYLRNEFYYSLQGVLWYTIGEHDWRCSGLVSKGIKQPAWYPWLQMTQNKALKPYPQP